MGGSSATAISWSTRRGPSPSAGRVAVGRVEAAVVVGRAEAGQEAVGATGAARRLEAPGQVFRGLLSVL